MIIRRIRGKRHRVCINGPPTLEILLTRAIFVRGEDLHYYYCYCVPIFLFRRSNGITAKGRNPRTCNNSPSGTRVQHERTSCARGGLRASEMYSGELHSVGVYQTVRIN